MQLAIKKAAGMITAAMLSYFHRSFATFSFLFFFSFISLLRRKSTKAYSTRAAKIKDRQRRIHTSMEVNFPATGSEEDSTLEMLMTTVNKEIQLENKP